MIYSCINSNLKQNERNKKKNLSRNKKKNLSRNKFIRRNCKENRWATILSAKHITSKSKNIDKINREKKECQIECKKVTHKKL